MCGFAGIVNFASSEPPAIDEALLRRMGEPVAHRGPDGTGVWISPDGRAGLIHHRLAIVDLDAGRQPMSNEDDTVWIVFNGEIYNHPELREELAAAGHAFKTDHSDTEVIIHAYEQWGRECPARLRGQFAFAIVDLNKQDVFLARDRLGQKPLYVRRLAGGGMVFGSGQLSLSAVAGPIDIPNPRAVFEFLRDGYTLGTAWPGIQIQPARCLALTEGPDISVEHPRYGTLEKKAAEAIAGQLFFPRAAFWQADPVITDSSLEQATKHVRSILAEATELRLRADVEIGCFLSGGIDSAVVASLIRREFDRPLKTFTIGTPDPAYDEREPARRVAKELGSEHVEFEVQPEHLLNVLDDMIAAVAEPFADSSIIPAHWVAKLTRANVKVALSGDGGDEAFAGYDRYRAVQLAQTLGWTRPLWVLSWPILERLARGGFRSRWTRLRRFADGMRTHPSLAYSRWMELFSQKGIDRLMQPDWRKVCRPCGPLDERLPFLPPVEDAMWEDYHHYLPGDILTKVDRASMAVALEVRSPFLDHKVVELAVSLPSKWKLRGRQSKWILREAFKDIVPAHVWDQPKRGFGLPLDRWFRRPTGSGQEGKLDGLLRESVAYLPADVFNHDYVNELIARHQIGREEHSQRLWALLWLGRWWKRFVG